MISSRQPPPERRPWCSLTSQVCKMPRCGSTQSPRTATDIHSSSRCRTTLRNKHSRRSLSLQLFQFAGQLPAPKVRARRAGGHGCATYNFLHMGQGLVVPAARRFGRVRWGHNDLQAGALKAQKAERPLAKIWWRGPHSVPPPRPQWWPLAIRTAACDKVHCTLSTTVMGAQYGAHTSCTVHRRGPVPPE